MHNLNSTTQTHAGACNARLATEKVLTGDRPTGSLHLGHFVGSLKQRVLLQQQYQQTILVADMQGLTDNGFKPTLVAANILNLVADYLAVGIEPSKTTICLQSALPALAELTMYYSNLVTVARLERNPTVKNEIANKAFGQSVPAGFLTYPISQAADITGFMGTLVPVGDDQLPMIEQTNEIVRKVNHIAGQTILVECRPLLSQTPRLVAPDGKNKMSKSMGNCIYLGSDPQTIRKAVQSMYTDPNHLNISDPGRIEGNVVFSYLDAFHPEPDTVAKLKIHYRQGGLGDGQVKKQLEECLQQLLAPIRAKRELYLSDKQQLLDILKAGTELAQQETEIVVKQVKNVFGLSLF